MAPFQKSQCLQNSTEGIAKNYPWEKTFSNSTFGRRKSWNDQEFGKDVPTKKPRAELQLEPGSWLTFSISLWDDGAMINP
jgi:hypothetical protein